MAVERTETLDDPPGAFLEYHEDGRIVAKNADGVIIKHPATYHPPEAMAAVKLGHSKRRSAPVLAEVDELLEALSPELLADKREGWIIRHLAAALVTGGAGSASIARELIMRLGLPNSQAMRPPEEGQPCPTCKRVYYRNEPIGPELLRDLLGDLRRIRGGGRLKPLRETEGETQTP